MTALLANQTAFMSLWTMGQLRNNLSYQGKYFKRPTKVQNLKSFTLTIREIF